MLFKRDKMRVVPTEEYTDYTERFEALDKMREESNYATRKDVMIMGAVPVAGAAGLFAYNKFSAGPSTINEVVPAVYQPIQSVQPVPDVPVMSDPSSTVDGMIQTGVIADTSLEVLATILNPVIDILVAISFPIASVIMVGACFWFMIGNSEKGWSMIMNAGLGYVLIQLSPLFLEILRTVGEAV
ncbi:hypothetical protein [Lysinibacillus odysseyi]|uniref:hypothetical protein n=1 Tax=Lysinibacillus odysseyi TaxID=202611 RepID=UPI00056B256B|nr:hypothetical protein [Lysinibacillus odysseyi]